MRFCKSCARRRMLQIFSTHSLDFFIDDFYVESDPTQKLGFPPGIAEKLIINGFHKWKNILRSQKRVEAPNNYKTDIDNESSQNHVMIGQEYTKIPQVGKEVEIDVHDGCQPIMLPVESSVKDCLSDSYNGAVRENYTWSQTISDLDVLVKLPGCLNAAKDLKVKIGSKEIKVEAKRSAVAENQDGDDSFHASWITIFEGELCFKTRKDESMWSIEPGRHISIHLEKASERWWEALILGEPKIELRNIDCSKRLHDMNSEEQMKVQELMWNHRQKILGKPTSEQIKMEKVLKKAWDVKGSPFEGTTYDPSILKFN